MTFFDKKNKIKIKSLKMVGNEKQTKMTKTLEN